MDNAMSLGILEGICPAVPTGFVENAACLVAAWEVPILGGLLVAVVLGILWRRRTQRRSVEGRPLLVFPLAGGGGVGETRRPGASVAPGWPPEGAAPGPATPPGGREPATSAGPERRDPGPGTREGSAPDPTSRMTIPTGPAGPDAPSGDRDEATPSRDTGTVTYQRPPDGTLQLLPGRLEIEVGPDRGDEIRFVRLPGAPAEISFGREEGPEYRHVRLDSPTVSRRQARMTFRGGVWTLRNESSTNPTTVNGRVLSSDVEEVPLANGDRIEMGDLGFRFRHEASQDRLPFRSSWYTDQGRRATNQDAVIVRSLPGGRELAAVCDGMGSHHAGGIASHLALETLVRALSDGSDLGPAVEEAHRAVLEEAQRESDREGMGTTLVALLRDGDRYDIANVGDSRAYRVDDGGIRQLTLDHSFIAEATRDGRMSAEEAARSPWRNAVTRNLGAESGIEVDLFQGFDSSEGHLVLLCTDGIHGVLSSEAIVEVVRGTADIRDLARALSEEALVRGGEDNVAVAAMAFGSTVADASGPGGAAP